jgi:hypothetical protein
VVQRLMSLKVRLSRSRLCERLYISVANLDREMLAPAGIVASTDHINSGFLDLCE